MTDEAKTGELVRLFAVPREERDDAWLAAFYAAVPDAALTTGEHEVIRGPDDMPYFRLLVPEPGAAFEPFSVRRVLDGCLERGAGVVVMSAAPRPEWVFRYGDLWAFRAEGRFDTAPPPGASAGAASGGSALFASPSEALLPAYARGVLRRVLTEAGVTPGVLLVTQPGAAMERSLVLPVYPDQFADQAAFDAFLRRLTWYLPPHLGLVTAERGGGVPEFGPL